MTPFVSIVTATHNRPHLLRQALTSIRAQSFQDFESIVVDDGSTAEVHKQYRELWKDLDHRFTLHLASPPGGPGSDPGRGRNFGARLARGTIVAFLDHDDIWFREDHLDVGVRALHETGADYYFSHVRFEPHHDDLMWVAPPQAFTACEQVLRDPVVHRIPVRRYLEVMRRFHVHPSHSMVRVEAFRAAGEFIEGLKTADDVNLTLRMADVARGILYRPEPCVTMRLPDGRSFSLASSRFDQILAEHHAMLDVRSRGRSAAVRAAGRARQAWALRQLSREVAAHSHREAARLAWEAVVAYPTAGAGWFLVKSLLGGIIGP